MKKIKMGMLVLTFTCLLCGCNNSDSSAVLKQMDASEIEKITCSGTTGGEDGEFTYSLSEKEKRDFVALLNQVELGEKVESNQALSSGAVSYYTLQFKNGDQFTLCPGEYFKIEDTYYSFENAKELWDSFVEMSSK